MTDHIPVMMNEVLEYLKPADNETYIDATFGAGGYTRRILGTANCNVIAFDRDVTAYENGVNISGEYNGRLTMVHSPFSHMFEEVAEGQDIHGIVMDLGVSSMQIDQAERGFSFRFDGPLDMRMDTTAGQTAADLVNEYDEKDISDILFKYGDEKFARKIARGIVRVRADEPFKTTKQLADFVSDTLPYNKKDNSHPATRTFQALRIAVNDELGELERGLAASENLLKPGGRLVVVTFHSLEDRIVKSFLNKCALKDVSVSRYMPDPANENKPTFDIMSRKPVLPTGQEINRNQRSRSAKLRAAIRTDEPAMHKIGGGSCR